MPCPAFQFCFFIKDFVPVFRWHQKINNDICLLHFQKNLPCRYSRSHRCYAAGCRLIYQANKMPSILMVSSMVSRVVPAISLTIALSSCSSASAMDLPELGLLRWQPVPLLYHIAQLEEFDQLLVKSVAPL